MSKKIATFLFLILLVLLLIWFRSDGQTSPLPLPEAILEIPKPSLENKEIVVATAGDISCSSTKSKNTECGQNLTADLINSINPDIVLALGDIQYGGGTTKDYQNYFDLSWGKFKDKIYPAVGNHEYETKGAKGYFDYFPKINNQHFYSFDIGGWHIISLDSNCWAVGGCGQNSPQLEWLISDLEKNNQKCTLAFWHHPRFSSGLHGNYNLVQPFWEILYQHHADLILNGHDHTYERFLPQNPQAELDQSMGITEFVVGTGGRSLYPFINIKENSTARYNQGFGVLKLTLKESSADFEFLTTGNADFKDIGSINCH